MRVIENLFRNNFAFYSFLGITYILVFSGVGYSIEAISDVRQLKQEKALIVSELEETESEVNSLAFSQRNQNQEIASIESRIQKAVKEPQKYEDIIKKRIWGKDEIKIFCKKLTKLNPGFKCPPIPD